MQLSNTASWSVTRQSLTPKIYSGWALDRAIILDGACPGLLASTLYFGAARRQAVLLLLASYDWFGQAEIARRLRPVAEDTDAPGNSDPAVIGRAILLCAARAILFVYSSAPYRTGCLAPCSGSGLTR